MHHTRSMFARAPTSINSTFFLSVHMADDRMRSRSRSPQPETWGGKKRADWHRPIIIQCSLEPMQKYHRVSPHFECLRDSNSMNLSPPDKKSLYTFWKYIYGGWTWKTKVADIAEEICDHMKRTFGLTFRTFEITLTFLGRQGAFEVGDTEQSIEDVLETNFPGWRSKQFYENLAHKDHDNEYAAFVLEMACHPNWCPELPFGNVSRPDPPSAYLHWTPEDETKMQKNKDLWKKRATAAEAEASSAKMAGEVANVHFK